MILFFVLNKYKYKNLLIIPKIQLQPIKKFIKLYIKKYRKTNISIWFCDDSDEYNEYNTHVISIEKYNQSFIYKNIKYYRIVLDQVDIFNNLEFLNPSYFTWIISSNIDKIFYTKLNVFKSIFKNMPYSHFQSLIVNIDEEYYKNIYKLPNINEKNIYFNNKFKLSNFNIINTTLNLLNKNKFTEIKKILNHRIQSVHSVKDNFKQNLSPNKYKEVCNRIDNHKCNICFDDISILPVNSICCINNFCIKCYFNWIKNNNSCPICRKETNLNDLRLISQTPIKHNKNINKMDKLIKLIYNPINNNILENTLICLHKNTDLKLFLKEFTISGNIDYNIYTNKFYNNKINIFIYNNKLLNYDFVNIQHLIFFNIENSKIKDNIIKIINCKDRNKELNIYNFINK